MSIIGNLKVKLGDMSTSRPTIAAGVKPFRLKEVNDEGTRVDFIFHLEEDGEDTKGNTLHAGWTLRKTLWGDNPEDDAERQAKNRDANAVFIAKLLKAGGVEDEVEVTGENFVTLCQDLQNKVFVLRTRVFTKKSGEEEADIRSVSPYTE